MSLVAVPGFSLIFLLLGSEASICFGHAYEHIAYDRHRLFGTAISKEAWDKAKPCGITLNDASAGLLLQRRPCFHTRLNSKLLVEPLPEDLNIAETQP